MIHALFLVTLAGWLPQDEPEEIPLEQEIEALIAKTNALESFRLVYDFESTTSNGETEAGTIEILYRAPDFGRAHVSVPSNEMDFWLVGDDVLVYVPEKGWKRGRIQEPAVCAVLDERFPLPDTATGGITLTLGLRRNADGQAGMDVHMGRGIGERKFLFSWLRSQSAASDVAREADAFVRSSDGDSRRVSRRTGLLEEHELESPEMHIRLRLRSSELDVELPPELLDPPREALDQPEDLELSRQLVHIPVTSLRRQAFERADRWLTRTANGLDERARANWRAVLEALHRPILEATHTRIDSDVGEKLEGAAEHLREERLRDPSAERLAKLTEGLGKSRDNLASSLANSLEKELEGLGSLDSVSHAGLHEVEHEIYSALWDELVATPLLARHDEELAAALER